MRTRDALTSRLAHSGLSDRAAPPARRRFRRAAPRLRASGPPGAIALVVALVACVAFIAFVAQVVVAPIALAHGKQTTVATAPQRPAHALPVRSDPPADAILRAPPTQVRMWFSEAVNPLDSRLVVVDPSNHEVDAHDSHVDATTQTEMVVGLQLLRPGAYIVIWRTQSAVDGHVATGNYLFRIANANGTVPPIPATLPNGKSPGAAGYGSSAQPVDGPSALQALSDWLALLFALFWVGGVIWEAWVLPARRAPDAITALGAQLAERRFQRLAPYALAGALLADVGMALALTIEIAGAWSGAVNGQYWRAVLFGSSFGAYWWLRQGVLLVALVIALLTLRAARRADSGVPDASASLEAAEPDEALAEDEPVPAWTSVALQTLRQTLRQTPRLPLRLARGWLDLTPLRQAEVALGALLLFAFAMSGHAAATAPSQRGFAVSVDLAHLIFSAIWLGGLLYISVVLLPAARTLPERLRALLLARGAPEFGAIAIVSAAALALTGSLNATVHLTSLAQFATTAYGITLFVKIELFLIMAGISAYHAFWLRPRLTRALARTPQARLTSLSSPTALTSLREVASVGAQRVGTGAEITDVTDVTEGEDAMPAETDAETDAETEGAIAYERAALNGHLAGTAHADGAARDETRRLRTGMEDWLRREALLGVGVLLCVALLALFAGTLTPTQGAAPVTTTSAFKQTQTVSGYAITLQVDPAKFGQNTFTVTVANAQGMPASGASVLLQTQDLDMDMGAQTLQLQPVGAAQPGAYSGQGDLTMAGNWVMTVKVLPAGSKSFITADYTLVAGS